MFKDFIRKYKAPSILTVKDIMENEETKLVGGDWVPARPTGFNTLYYRATAAWLVFTGRADAVIWEKGQ